MRNVFHLAGLLGFIAGCAETAVGELPQPGWGRIVSATNGTGVIRLEVSSWPADGKLSLPTPFAQITMARFANDSEAGAGTLPAQTALRWVFNADASQLHLEAPPAIPTKAAVIELETAEKTTQFPDGRIIFSALDAKVSGSKAKLESHPGNHRIGFWTDANDAVSWDYKPTRWGSYDVELAYSADGGDGTELQIEIAGQTFNVTRPSTGSWYRYQSLALGRFYLAKQDPFTVKVSCKSLKGVAVMNLKALTFRPAPEGPRLSQSADGIIALPASNAVTHSVTMRYEPAAIKNCLGYWVNPADWAGWEFDVPKPGAYDVEVWQGCGKGQGGSDVAVEVGGMRFDFVVEETGHFQIFLPRRIGRVSFDRAGPHRLSVKPQRKQAGAIMDIRQVRLLPVAAGDKQLQFPGKRSRWFGFERFDFEVDGKPVLVVAPKLEAPGRPWLWHGEFFGHKPNPDLALLGRGFHIVYMNVPDMLGSPEAVAHWNEFHRELTERYGFAKKPALVGLSRGGLYCYNWAIANPDKVACVYGDAPVCDFKSWPGGKGKGPGSARDWQLVMERYHFKSEAEALAYDKNPVDLLGRLAEAKVPLLHVFGDADEAVPWDENTGVVAERYQKLGGSITLIRKPGVKHHPHGLDDSTPIVDFIWTNAASAEARQQLAKHGGGPLDVGLHPLIRRLGTIDLDLVETTPVVFGGKVWRFEWVRQGTGQQYWDNQRQTNYFRFRDPATGEVTPPFADGHEFGSAFVHDGTVYVTGTQGRNRINLFTSRDLKTWEKSTVLNDPRYGIFNTSMCKAGNEFVLMFEIDKPVEEAGAAFTARFLKSRDLRTWTLTPPECNYAKDRYTAPHCVRWLDGWFYDFYLEAHDGYEMRVVRSRDLMKWEASPLNPVLRHSPEDKLIANPKLTDAQRSRIANATNLNNSDIDFSEWQGRLVINYSWGNQQGVEHLAEAVYDGTEAQFLRGWFPE